MRRLRTKQIPLIKERHNRRRMRGFSIDVIQSIKKEKNLTIEKCFEIAPCFKTIEGVLQSSTSAANAKIVIPMVFLG